jgi:hypothetical protein
MNEERWKVSLRAKCNKTSFQVSFSDVLRLDIDHCKDLQQGKLLLLKLYQQMESVTPCEVQQSSFEKLL